MCRALQSAAAAVVAVVAVVVVVVAVVAGAVWLVCVFVSQGSADQSTDEQTINKEITNNKQQQSLTTAITITCGLVIS